MIEFIKAVDMKIDLWLQNFSNPVFDFIAIALHYIGDKGIIFILIGIALMVFKKYRHVGLAIFVAQGINGVVVQILKDVIARPRPFVVDPSITPLVAESPTSSMPSGHASSAFAFAIVIAYYFPKSKPYMITFAIIMSVSRLYAFVHFPTDVILGSIIGILSAYITIYFVDKYLCKKIFK
jgi:undecaprenyl-diphosphatase